MKQLGILLAITLLCGQLKAQKVSFSLAEAQAYALDNNDSLKLLKLDMTKAEKQVIETRAIGLPQLNAKSSFQYFFDIPTQLLPDFISPSIYGVLIQEGLIEPRTIEGGGMTPAQFGTDYNISAGIDANQLLFDGQYIVGLRAARTFKALSASMLSTNQISVKANIAKLYMQVLVLKQTVDLLNNNKTELDRSIREMTAMLDEGLADGLDVDRLKLAKQRIDHQEIIMGRTHEVVQLLLKLQMGFPVDQEIDLTDNLDQFVESGSEDLLNKDSDAKSRPEYKTLQVNSELQNLDRQRYQAGYLPQLVGFFSYSQNAYVNDLGDAGDGENWFPTTVGGVTLNVPVFDGLTKSAKIQQAKIEMEKAEIVMHQFEEAVKMQVMSSKNAYMNAKESYDIEKANMDLSKKIYDQSKIKYEEGVGSSLEMTSALTDYYTAQSAYVSSSYEFIKARINLEKALGNYN